MMPGMARLLQFAVLMATGAAYASAQGAPCKSVEPPKDLNCVRWIRNFELDQIDVLCSSELSSLNGAAANGLQEAERAFWMAVASGDMDFAAPIMMNRSEAYQLGMREIVATAIGDQFIWWTPCCVGNLLLGESAGRQRYGTYSKTVYRDAAGNCRIGLGMLAWSLDELGWRLEVPNPDDVSQKEPRSPPPSGKEHWEGVSTSRAALIEAGSPVEILPLTARRIASSVTPKCHEFMIAFLAGRWRERQNPLGEGDIPEIEAQLLDAFVMELEKYPQVQSIELAYGARLLTGERRRGSAAERQVGRRMSVGDMYVGPLSGHSFGDEFDPDVLPEVVAKEGPEYLFVDVPVTLGNRFVCGLVVTFAR